MQETRFFRDVGEAPLASIAIERVLSPICHEQIVKAVIIEIAHTSALTPTIPRQIGLFGNVGESPVLVVAVKMADRLLAILKTFERGPVDEKNIQPAVVIVVNQGDAAAGGLDDVFLLGFRAGHMPR